MGSNVILHLLQIITVESISRLACVNGYSLDVLKE